jgi:proline dehydrogenase
MPSNPLLSFSNTQNAFAHKTTKALKKSRFLFYVMGKNWVVKWGAQLAPWALKIGLPVKGIIRQTIFNQFVGGETLKETEAVTNALQKHNVKVIIDYGVEGGSQNNKALDVACDEFVKVINYAAKQPSVPFISIKVTGIAAFNLLETLDEAMHQETGTLITKYHQALSKLTALQQQDWELVVGRLTKICASAYQFKLGVLVDAEETWIQDPVDAITMLMMAAYNQEEAIVYNTVQLYRHDRLSFLKDCLQAVTEKKIILGVKLVRGAYMEKERKRALENNYPSPIQASKNATDDDYNNAIELCIQNISNTAVIIASHNEQSNQYATELLHQNNLPLNHPHIHFSQLYGMSDNITFNLAAANCSVSKYLPFGPIEEVIPYLMRRAQENSSVAGQTGRELGLIKTELQRRANQ